MLYIQKLFTCFLIDVLYLAVSTLEDIKMHWEGGVNLSTWSVVNRCSDWLYLACDSQNFVITMWELTSSRNLLFVFFQNKVNEWVHWWNKVVFEVLIIFYFFIFLEVPCILRMWRTMPRIPFFFRKASEIWRRYTNCEFSFIWNWGLTSSDCVCEYMLPNQDEWRVISYLFVSQMYVCLNVCMHICICSFFL